MSVSTGRRRKAQQTSFHELLTTVRHGRKLVLHGGDSFWWCLEWRCRDQLAALYLASRWFYYLQFTVVNCKSLIPTLYMFSFILFLLLARLMSQYCFAGWSLSSSVTLPASGPAGRRARGRSGGRHCMTGQYGYDPLGRHFVLACNSFRFFNFSVKVLFHVLSLYTTFG